MTRRGLLGIVAAAATLALAPEALAAPLPQRKPLRAARVVRSIHLYNVHTGERVQGPYYEGGRYNGQLFRQITKLLRDHRSNELHRIDPALVDLMHAIQMRTGGGRKPLEIVSGYRSPQTNEMLRLAGYGVAENSYHLQGKAVDIRMAGVRVSQLSRLARDLGRGGVGTYGGSNFLHIDTGPVRRW
ncbi:MAG: DUF882 domain-containing protein [Alphaproteobacteria bacterium]